MNSFVGFSKEVLSVSKLLETLENLPSKPSYYFLRWTNRVSGIIKEPPSEKDFPMVEGQMFNHDYELRWRYKKQNTYEVLFLSTIGKHLSFEPLGSDWLIAEHNAYIHPKTETRFPKEFKTANVDIAQRYFIDKQTATIHFVALTTKK